MSRREWKCGVGMVAAAALAMLALASVPAEAQVVRVSRGEARHTININFGYFSLPGAESRVDDDAIVPNLVDLATRDDLENLRMGDFNNVTIGGEWLYGVTDYLEVGAGLGFYRKTVETTYARETHADGSDILQELKFRIVPISATVRFLPLGRGGVEPYVGVGIGMFSWRYTEIGEFIDEDGFIFSNVGDPFDDSGTAIGPVILGGVRAPIGDVWALGGEIRWQSAEDDGLFDEGFLGDKIDLGGWTFNVTFGIRF